MKIKLDIILNNILWILGLILAIIIMIVSAGEIDIRKKLPQKKSGKIIIRKKDKQKKDESDEKKDPVDINDIGDSEFDL